MESSLSPCHPQSKKIRPWFFVDSCKKNKRLGESSLPALLTFFTEGGLEQGELSRGEASVWGVMARLGGDTRSKDPLSPCPVQTHTDLTYS